MARGLGTTPTELGFEIDWLFREVSKELAISVIERRGAPDPQSGLLDEGPDFPEPGQDPELVRIISSALTPWLEQEPPARALQGLSQQIHAYLRIEKKRNNLLGEGFEDVLAAIVSRIPETRHLDLRARPLLHDVPGFFPTPDGEKARKVDLALFRPGGSHRHLLTAKWSIRSDREEQFVSDFRTYARLERANQPFQYVLVTNEFDPARLVAACERQIDGRPLFDSVVHINPQAPLTAYGSAPKRSAARVSELVARGRLIGLGTWLEGLADKKQK